MPDVSRRGVYYNLEKSPYRYKVPYGGFLKFSSKKKLEMYTRDINIIREKIWKMLNKYKEFLGEDWIDDTIDYMESQDFHIAVYKRIEKGL